MLAPARLLWKMANNKEAIILAVWVLVLASGFAAFYFILPAYYPIQFASAEKPLVASTIVHLKTPSPLKAIYLTSWTAGSIARRGQLIDLIDATELNAIVFDIKDYKGLSWLDVGAPGVWDYIVLLAKESYALGFDELNFDYIRFPSDGNMKDIYYPWSDGYEKPEVLREFFSYLHDKLKLVGAVLSADLFGMTTTNTDDLNIGQVLEVALPYFDYIAPMVYPSHYPPTFIGLGNPAAHPYEVVRYS